jgi:hypothetical protein
MEVDLLQKKKKKKKEKENQKRNSPRAEGGGRAEPVQLTKNSKAPIF